MATSRGAFALEGTGAAGLTTIVIVSEAWAPTPLLAKTWTVYVPAVFGRPEMVPVALAWGTNCNPLGRAPMALMVGDGLPVAVMVNAPGRPTWK
jgi:hypothetical protein